MKDCPLEITPEFLTWLAQACPDRCPDITTPDRQVWFEAGQASVVRFFRRIHEEQNENILTRKITADVPSPED